MELILDGAAFHKAVSIIVDRDEILWLGFDPFSQIGMFQVSDTPSLAANLTRSREVARPRRNFSAAMNSSLIHKRAYHFAAAACSDFLSWYLHRLAPKNELRGHAVFHRSQLIAVSFAS